KRIKETDTDSRFESELHSIVRDLNNDHSQVVSYNDLRGILGVYYNDEPYKTTYKSIFTNKKVIERYKIEKGEKLGEGSRNEKIASDYPSNIIAKDIVDNKVAYIYMPSMEGNYDITKRDMDIVEDYISTRRIYDAIVLDIRGNGGGSDIYWRCAISTLTNKTLESTSYILFRTNSNVMKNALEHKVNYRKGLWTIKDIKDLPNSTITKAPEESKTMFDKFVDMKYKVEPKGNGGFNGKVYLLVDKQVYSAAEGMAIFCKETRYATIIGEKTGGDGLGFEPVLFNLNNSGIIVKIAGGMGLTESGVCNEEFKTTPDVLVNNCTRSNNLNEDKCIQKVLELEKLK
ncbi:MAG: S41 family peptidase, partial [Clostridium sp.]